MQCDRCSERPASVHLTQIVNNSVTTVHLCDQCAAGKGVQTNASVAKFPLSDFLASMGKGGGAGACGEVTVGDDSALCDFCQGTLRDFRDTGRLGCPHCYDAFGRHLRDLLRRLHGSNQHVGERYDGAHSMPVRETKIGTLRDQLQRAVEVENFELAAELRDKIRVIE